MKTRLKIKSCITSSILILICGLLIFVSGCRKDEKAEQERKAEITISLNDQISADSLESMVAWLQSRGTRFALSDSRRNVALSIRDRFIKMGYPDARIDSFMISKTYRNVFYQQWQYNIIASIRGKTYPDSICILGGHYDSYNTGDAFSFAPGANDNASGVAAVFEIARVMKQDNFSPRNTIEFIAFGSEELGLFGSSAYAANAREKSKNIIMMLNNDMIAYQPDPRQSEWVVNINDYDNSHNLRVLAEGLCSRFTILKSINVNTYNKQTDSYPFYAHGFKALYFAANYIDPNYHTLADVVDNCNFIYCREIVKISCALLVENN